MSWVREAMEAIRADEPGIRVHVEWRARSLTAALTMLAVPEDRRGQGAARRAVETLVVAADLAGAQLAVTPTDEFGADLARLRRFYEGFGFVRNTGEHRDWAHKEDYIRPVGGGRREEGRARGA